MCRLSTLPLPKSKSCGDPKVSSFVATRLPHCTDLQDGLHLHHDLVCDGHEKSKYVGSLLVQLYTFCGSLEDASSWFSYMDERNVFSWNLMIGALLHVQDRVTQNEGGTPRMFFQMQLEGILPNRVTYVLMFSACARQVAEAEGMQLHSRIAGSELEENAVLACAMINMYAKLNSIEKAQQTFDRVSNRDTILWNALLAIYVRSVKHTTEVVHMFHLMLGEGLMPDKVTFMTVLSTLSGSRALSDGKRVHVRAQSSSFLNADTLVGNTLINMYGRCAGAQAAQDAFEELTTQDVVTWNTLCTILSKHSLSQNAFGLFGRMKQQGIMPDEVSFIGALSVRVSPDCLQDVKLLHCSFVYGCFHSDTIVHNLLVHVYGRCGDLANAERLFGDAREPDVVAWNAMISLYVQSGQRGKAWQLLDQILQEAVLFDHITLINGLTACSCLDGFVKGKNLHTWIINSGFDSDLAVCNALITFYARNNDLLEAQKVFDMVKEPDVISWNAIITGYCKHGLGQEAVYMLGKMHQAGVIADKITLVAILDLCTNERDLVKGKHVHGFLLTKKVDIDVVMATALLNMYARCDSLGTARQVFDAMPERSAITWNCMLTAYLHAGEYEQVFQLFQQMLCEGEGLLDKAVLVTLFLACSLGTCHTEGKRLHSRVQLNESGLLTACLDAVVLMYAMCGDLELACALFVLANVNADQVPWSTFISSHCQHGKGMEALHFHERMLSFNVVPDKATSLSLLSSCSHTGLVSEAHSYLCVLEQSDSMQLAVEHYDCLLDVFGRAGLLNHAECIVRCMPFLPSDVSWLTFLAICRTQLDLARAQWAASHLLEVGQEDINTYIILSTVYSLVGYHG